ncbi:MAG: pyridoxamine 5'-phosphate oxidase family protein [Desulfobacterota bacterium]|nr:pyridoxamine 5'-phosphate oxidase family protein [Thermodesulfobacteriota bacterium]MDW8001253.1 pyridoxamine 5'-phosphate oxidase family protein [Deltaproteobacteria bacterium]
MNEKEILELKRIALKYIESHNTMTIATCKDNVPWAADVFYASSGFRLYFISNPQVAIHCKNIAANPIVSVAISEDYKLKGFSDWKRIKGIQMEGLAEMLELENEIKEALEIYIKKYPFTSPYLKKLFLYEEYTPLEKLLMRLKILPTFTPSKENRFFKVTPKRLFLVDNKRSFEKRIEIPLE